MKFSHHKYAIVITALAGLIMGLFACQGTTPFIAPANPNDPTAVQSTQTVNMTSAQLIQLEAQVESLYNQRQAKIEADRAAATQAAAAATSPAEKTAAATQMAAVTQEIDTFSGQVDAFNRQMDAATLDLKNKQAQQQTLLGGLVDLSSHSPTSPAGWLLAILGLGGALLGGGSTLDSLAKSRIINRLQTPAASAAGASN